MNELRVFVRAGRDLREILAHTEANRLLSGEKCLPGIVLDYANLPPIPGFDMDFLSECIAYAINEGHERSGTFEPNVCFPVATHWRLVEARTQPVSL